MQLTAALGLHPGEIVALVGAGGKTTAMARLARELGSFGPVVSTTTTHLALSERSIAPSHFIFDDDTKLEELGPLLREYRHVLVTGPALPALGKWSGLTAGSFSRLCELLQGAGVTLLVEADGARGLSLKAPDQHEPAVPREATQLVVLAGLDALGRPLNAETVHRVSRFMESAEAAAGGIITPGVLARGLTHVSSYAKVARRGMGFSIVLNKADTDEARQLGREAAAQLLHSPVVCRVVVASLLEDEAVYEARVRMGGVVLAAGDASRMGANKLLLPLRGRPILEHALEVARAHTHEVVVVLGADGSAIAGAVDLAGTRVVSNPAWREGQSTSLRAGLEALAPTCGAALFFLGDQPNVPGALVDRLIELHARTLSPIVAPRHAGRRANPVLFDRATWDDLKRVRGDEGGRGLFDRHPVTWVDWDDPEAFADVDTLEDYRRLQGRAG